MAEQPYLFVFNSASPAGVGANQGVAITPDASRLWAAGGITDTRTLREYDPVTFAELNSRNFLGQLPVGATQINGVQYFNGKLWLGVNNYATLPPKGWILEIDPDSLLILATHSTRDGFWCEGGSFYDGSFWAAYHNTHEVDRYDPATWTLIGSYDAGWEHVAAETYYQNSAWYGDFILLPTHGSQTKPKTIDVSEWDGAQFIPRHRVDAPTPSSHQGFSLTGDLATAYFAERDDVADQHRVVIADVLAVDPPNSGINQNSDQLENLIHWYPRLEWTGISLIAPDEAGAIDATVSDESKVYPILDPDHGYCMRFDVAAGSNGHLHLGDILPTQISECTISMWLKVRGTANASLIMQGNGSGNNPGDWQIVSNQSGTGRMRVLYDDIRNLDTAAAVFTVDQWFHFVFVLTDSGAQMWVDGVLVASNSNPGYIGGQPVRIGANFLDASSAPFDVFDFRLYDAPVAVAPLYDEATRYEAFSDAPPGPLVSGTLSFVHATETMIRLSWTNSSGGSRPRTYSLHRDTTAGFTPGAGNLIASDVSSPYEDTTGLFGAQRYYYKLVTTDNAALTITSNEVTAALAFAYTGDEIANATWTYADRTLT